MMIVIILSYSVQFMRLSVRERERAICRSPRFVCQDLHLSCYFSSHPIPNLIGAKPEKIIKSRLNFTLFPVSREREGTGACGEHFSALVSPTEKQEPKNAFAPRRLGHWK